MTSWWLLLALATPPHPCALVKGETITAGDVAALAPGFASLPADLPLAPAPSPGARRVFRSPELTAIARSHSLAIAPPPDNLCFEWPMQALDPQRLIAAMQAALGTPGARIEIVDSGARPAPPGAIEFRRADLPVPASKGSRTPVVWRGSIVYGANRRFEIWVRVVVSLPPAEINRGDLVEVEVRSGAARLLLRARSEADGRVGETIPLRNPSSNKVFQARVEGKGRALLETSEGPEN
jgi:hypothetical protein